MNAIDWIGVMIGLLVVATAGLGITAKAIWKTLQASTKAQQDIALALQALAEKSKEEKQS
jgi:hypothetical protein